MTKSAFNKFEELLALPKSLSLSDFELYIIEYLERKNDRKLAIQELDNLVAMVQNHLLSLSLFLKQNHILQKSDLNTASDVEYYTKQEVAARYRVSVRTVTNWIIDGLEMVEIGGVKRISNASLETFTKTSRGKKFSWKSIHH